MIDDVRNACWRLSRTPIVTAAILLSLGLGIGGTATIFSLVNALLLRPLPVPDPERLVTLSSNLALSHGLTTGLGWNHPIWLRMEERANLFDGALAWISAEVPLPDGAVARGVFTSGTFFPVLGVEAHRGRVYLPSDDTTGGGSEGPVGVISDQFWRRRFDRDPAAIGSVLTLGEGAITIIGVTREAFTGVELGRSFDVAMPFGAETRIRGDQSNIARPEQFLLTFMLRLKRGQSPASAEAALAAIQPHLIAGDNVPRFLEEPIRLVPAGNGADRHRLRWSYQLPLLAVFLAAGFTLLVACANIASLMLARATARTLELSVRVALGASRARVARHLLTESAVLASIGTCVGLLFAWWASRAAGMFLDASLNVAAESPFDWRVLVFAIALGATTTIFFGTAPAALASRSSPAGAIKAHNRRAGSGTFRTLHLFVVLQLALSTVLVVVTGLFVATSIRLSAVPLGFDPDDLLIVDVQAVRHPDRSVNPYDLQERLLDAARNVRGVSLAAASLLTPLSEASDSLWAEQRDIVLQNAVGPGWFRTYGTRLRAGRDFDRRDTAQAERVAIVNEAYVRKYLADRQPVGARVEDRTIVGVVEDAVFSTVRAGMRPTLYEPLAQVDPQRTRRISLSVRPTLDAPGPPHAIRAALMAVTPTLTFAIRPLSEDVARSTRQERLLAVVGVLLALLALSLAAIGLYGLMSQVVAKRRREFGIRLALGATHRHILRLVARWAIGLILVGSAAGGLASFWLTRYVQTLLYGVNAGDTATLAVAAALMTSVGLIAAWGPARDVLRLDPAETLRDY